MPKLLRGGPWARRLRRFALAVCFVLLAVVFAGPVLSGAVFLLLPAPESSAPRELPGSYEPLHEGHVDLQTGLYIRRNDDLVVRGTPALILRRTYLSGDRVSRQLGIGTTHDGERYLIGDGSRFQWAELVLADRVRIRFERTTPGTSIFGAMYEHRRSPGEWQGARLGWTGMHWALRRRDGTLMLFQGCVRAQVCSIIRERDADGHGTHYRRDTTGRLARIDASGDRWIAFDYDGKGRITRAHTSDRQEVRYEYDAGGRLAVATGLGGARSRYLYTDRDEMASIVEPGTGIENAFNADGRCVEQVNGFPEAEPYVFRFTYRGAKGAIVQTESEGSDGSWRRYTWDKMGYPTSEAWGKEGMGTAVFTYERDAETAEVKGLTLTCPDRTGRPLRHTRYVRPGHEDAIKWNLLTTHCSWTRRDSRSRSLQ